MSFFGHETIQNSFALTYDVNSGNLNSEKDSKDKAFSMKNITFRPKMY